ncbi:discoidin domain-containing protein [Dactylosporangium sp. McL0621]|uniref:discoidin domain-containing protein n=1 Tax=Dactylosporangium sp. McL0621 TaxID=3415678 RepID=UPI003CE800E7
MTEPTHMPAVPGWLVIDALSAPDLPAEGLEGVVLLDPDGSAAEDRATRLGRPVLAPAGPVVVSPGGTLFATGGWWRHTPGGRRVAAGPRFPAPAWPPFDLDATPIPAGRLLAAGTAPPEIAASIAVDPQRPLLVFDATVTGPALAAALRALSPADRAVLDVAALAPGQGAGRAVALAAAAELGEPVSLVNGLPLHTPSGDVVVYALDAALRPVWAEPAGRLRCQPDGREEVTASTPPQPGLRAVDAATYALDLGWLVRVSGGGLHAMPVGPLAPAVGRAAVPAPDPAPPASQEATVDLTPYRPLADGRYRVVVGTPGLEINDLVWPALSALFTSALTDVPAGVDLQVTGDATDWGRTVAAELAERHLGADTGPGRDVLELDGHRPDDGAALKPYAPAKVLTFGAEPEPDAAPPRRRRLVLAVAGAAAVLAVGAGIVAAWPGDRGHTDNVGTDPYLMPDISAGGATAGPSPSGSSRSASARPSASAGRPSGAPAPAASGPEGTRTSGSPDPLGLDNLFNLAAGHDTRDSGHADVYGSGNITDGDAGTYWESRNNAFPQWVQVDLGGPAQLRRAVLRLPPSAAWPARSQRIEVQASADDKTFTTLTAPASYTFDPASGQRATITLPGTPWRYVRLVFTANSVQSAGQLSALELYRL